MKLEGEVLSIQGKPYSRASIDEGLLMLSPELSIYRQCCSVAYSDDLKTNKKKGFSSWDVPKPETLLFGMTSSLIRNCSLSRDNISVRVMTYILNTLAGTDLSV